MRNVKSKNCQTDKDVLLRVEGQKREIKTKRRNKKAGKKILFIFCEQKPIFNG
jgi:hypothetical protein